MKNWIIKLLGGITKQEMEEFRDKCEEFTFKNLIPKDKDVIVANIDIENLKLNEHKIIMVLSSYVSIRNNVLNNVQIYVAPWCRFITISNNYMTGEKSDENDQTTI